MEIEAALVQFAGVLSKHQGSVYPESKLPRLNFSPLRQLLLRRSASTSVAYKGGGGAIIEKYTSEPHRPLALLPRDILPPHPAIQHISLLLCIHFNARCLYKDDIFNVHFYAIKVNFRSLIFLT